MSGNSEEMEEVLNSLLFDSISIRDTFSKKSLRENFYHGFVLGLLTGFKNVCSNMESGNAYSDITVLDKASKTVAILELKYADSDSVEVMERACEQALAQIEDKQYEAPFVRARLAKTVLKYGISFNKKLSCVLDA